MEFDGIVNSAFGNKLADIVKQNQENLN